MEKLLAKSEEKKKHFQKIADVLFFIGCNDYIIKATLSIDHCNYVHFSNSKKY